MSDFEKRVKTTVAAQLGVTEAEVRNESSFVDDLGAEPLDAVELMMALEGEFGMQIPDEEADRLTTVQHVIDYARAHATVGGN